MTRSSLAYNGFVLAMAVVLPAVPATSVDAATRKAHARATRPRPVAADMSVIVLPLTPIVPAAQRVCANRAPSGLGFTILHPSGGARPARDAAVLINYIGYLATTGAVFDQGMRASLSVDEVIPGFAEGLQMMGRTGIVRLCIPAAMAYGTRSVGPIPANSDLVFQIELVDFKTGTGTTDPQ